MTPLDIFNYSFYMCICVSHSAECKIRKACAFCQKYVTVIFSVISFFAANEEEYTCCIVDRLIDNPLKRRIKKLEKKMSRCISFRIYIPMFRDNDVNKQKKK